MATPPPNEKSGLPGFFSLLMELAAALAAQAAAGGTGGVEGAAVGAAIETAAAEPKFRRRRNADAAKPGYIARSPWRLQFICCFPEIKSKIAGVESIRGGSAGICDVVSLRPGSSAGPLWSSLVGSAAAAAAAALPSSVSLIWCISSCSASGRLCVCHLGLILFRLPGFPSLWGHCSLLCRGHGLK